VGVEAFKVYQEVLLLEGEPRVNNVVEFGQNIGYLKVKTYSSHHSLPHPSPVHMQYSMLMHLHHQQSDCHHRWHAASKQLWLESSTAAASSPAAGSQQMHNRLEAGGDQLMLSWAQTDSNILPLPTVALATCCTTR
jgi:hypothetical protein